MRTKLFLTALFITILLVACAPAPAPSVVYPGPSPTPPPIPTSMVPQDSSIGGGGGDSGGGGPAAEATIPPNQAGVILYGSSRGDVLSTYYINNSGEFFVDADLEGDSGGMAVWPDVSPDGKRIAFVALNSSLLTNGIFIKDSTDNSLFQLTQGDGQHPKWSPDGSRIAYTCNGGNDVCVVTLGGTDIQNLTNGQDGIDSHPDWTPDGRIVFMSNRDVSKNGLFAELYIMNSDGSQVEQITNDKKFYNSFPSVSPDGSKIVYESNIDVGSGSEIYISNIDGSNRFRVTSDLVWDQIPVWSPDGSVIMYAANDGNGNIDLYQINPDGSNRYRLTQNPAEDGGFRLGHTYLPQPVGLTNLASEKQLSVNINLPDGSSAVSNGVLFSTNSFNCEDCLETGIYFVTYDGANLQKLPISGFYPAWSPSFTKIAYVVNGELWIANADSSNPAQVTHAFYNLASLQWSADGKKILANCQPYGQHDTCLIDLDTGAVQNILEPLIFGSGIPYPSFFSAERILIGAQILDLIGVQVGTTSVPGRNAPDEKRFAAIVKKQVVLMNADGSNQLALTTDSSTKGFPIWSPDSGLVIYTVAPGDGRLYLWAARADAAAPPYQLVARPIAEGPTSKPASLTIYYGYSWAP